MKKTILAFMASLMLGTSLYAGATDIEVWRVGTFSTDYHTCEKDGYWDYVQESQNVTYNSQTGDYVTVSCHTGLIAYMDVVVWGTNITKTPIVGAGGDMTIHSTYTASSYKIFRFIKDDPDGMDTSGVAKAFYSEGNTVLSSMDKFLRFP